MPDVFAARLPLPTPTRSPALLSVVVPLFDEQETLPHLYRRLVAALDPLRSPFELVFVNDGSRDNTATLLDRLAATDPRVVVVHLTRNFGHQPAVSAGLATAAGEVVVVMDGDLQDPPELLPALLARWRSGAEVVYAVRTKRKEGPARRLGYFLFYRLLRRVSDLDLPLDAGDFCLMDRAVVDAVNALPERVRFVRGLRAFVGFRQEGLVYERDARAGGVPKYTFRKLAGLAVEGVVSFSGGPLRAVTAGGVVLGGIASLVGLAAMVRADGLLGVAAVVLAAAACQVIAVGVVGEYVRRIFLEVKGRPTYLVRRVVRRESVERAA
jgi:glycosyltransferase involved in cell wall biosynthesis